MKAPFPPRIVFDTNVVLSAVLFRQGRLSWLRAHWQAGEAVPLISDETLRELVRVLSYGKFRLNDAQRAEAAGLYLPHCERIEPTERCPALCRDPKDQALLDLAESGKADVLVTGDKDLLALAGQTTFVIETPEEYRRRFA